MYRVTRLSLLLLPAMLLSACQLFEPLPTLPPVLTLEPLESEPVVGLLPASSTPEPMAGSPQASQADSAQPGESSAAPSATQLALFPTLTQVQEAVAASATGLPTSPPAATATLPAPTSASPATWRNVPIMPEAAESGEEDGTYSYTINASVGEVQAFYERQMHLAGWAYFASGEGEAGNLLLMYQKDNITATIGVITQDGSTLVLLVAE